MMISMEITYFIFFYWRNSKDVGDIDSAIAAVFPLSQTKLINKKKQTCFRICIIHTFHIQINDCISKKK